MTYCKIVLVIYCISVQISAAGQSSQQIDEKPGDKKESTLVSNPTQFNDAVDVNFMFNYYNQDGNHSAVTGGLGTESLTDRAIKIEVNVPVDSITSIQVNAHANVYTSASTDNIDSNISSASRHDLRIQADVGFTRVDPEKQSSHYFKLGGSTESDYISLYAGGGWVKDFNEGNTQIGIGIQAFFDTWLLIFPEELRVPEETSFITTNRRRSYSLSLSYAQVINKRLQGSISTDLVYQHGLLSTPFHRVYFPTTDLSKIERLPGSRFKFPLAGRLNYYFNDWLIIRLFYRYYQDDFEIQAHTFSIETPVKLSNYFSIYPFFRWHSQNASKYFSPYKEARIRADFYSSDYDLSAFDSQKFGLGLVYSPLYGLGRFRFFSKKKITVFKSLALRLAHYQRGDGLRANMISFDLAFSSD